MPKCSRRQSHRQSASCLPRDLLHPNHRLSSKTESGFQDFSPAVAAEESAAPPPPPLLSEKFIENGPKALPALDVTLQVDGAAAADFDAHAFRRRLATLLSVDIAEVDALKLSQADDAANHLNVTTSVVSADATVVDAASRALRGADVNALSYALHVKLTSPPEQHVDLKVPALTFGDVTTMYKGLSSLVGPCPDDMSEAVRCEHCECDDSHLEFLTGNYGVRTTSAIEYHFVVDPDPKRHANSMRLGDRDGRADGRDFEWPFEEKLRADESQRHRCRVAKPRKPLTVSERISTLSWIAWAFRQSRTSSFIAHGSTPDRYSKSTAPC